MPHTHTHTHTLSLSLLLSLSLRYSVNHAHISPHVDNASGTDAVRCIQNVWIPSTGKHSTISIQQNWWEIQSAQSLSLALLLYILVSALLCTQLFIQKAWRLTLKVCSMWLNVWHHQQTTLFFFQNLRVTFSRAVSLFRVLWNGIHFPRPWNFLDQQVLSKEDSTSTSKISWLNLYLYL